MTKMRWPSLLLLAAAALLTYGCASVAGTSSMVQAPRVHASSDRPAELSVGGDGAGTVTAWARVKNPNGFAITLTKVHGLLYLADRRAARLDVDTKLELKAREEATVPFALPFGGKEAKKKDKDPGPGPALGATSGSAVSYRFDGNLNVSVGDNLETVFGPLTLLEGQARVR